MYTDAQVNQAASAHQTHEGRQEGEEEEMRRNTRLRPAGVTIHSSVEADRHIECDTRQCVHCGGHYEVRPGSGQIRGYCTRCAGPVCGPRCGGKCVPVEQMLENMEAGRPEDFMPVRVNVPKLWLPNGD